MASVVSLSCSERWCSWGMMRLQSQVGQCSNFVTGVRLDQSTVISHDASRRALPNLKGERAPCSSSALPPPFLMPRISDKTRCDTISLIDASLSTRKIARQLGVSHMTVNRVRAKARPHAQKRRGGRPAKLTATDKRRLVRKITSGEADNAVQLTRQLNDATSVECNPQTVRRALKEAGLKAVVKKKGLDLNLGTSPNATSSPRSTSTGPWTTGSASFGPTKQRSIVWVLMGGSGCGKSVVGCSQGSMFRARSSLAVEA